MKLIVADNGDYATMPKADYGHDAFGNVVSPETGYEIVPWNTEIQKGDKPFDVYAGWMEYDDYYVGAYAKSSGRWTTWERPVR